MLLDRYTKTLFIAFSTFSLSAFAATARFNVPGIGPLEESYVTPNRDSTWVGRKLPLDKKYRAAPTVENCEEIASQIYREIAKLLDHTGRSAKQIERNEERVYGTQGSRELVVSVFTYPGSDYFWACTVPHGLEKSETLNRIRQSTVMRTKLTMTNRFVVHAEECVFSRFEFDQPTWEGKADGRYPPGSVVGTWHLKGAKKKLEGQQFSACENDVRGNDNNRAKNNRACEVVTRDLGVSARINGEVRIRSNPRPSSDSSSRGANTLLASTRRAMHSSSHGAKGSNAKVSVTRANTRKSRPTQASANHHRSTKTQAAGAKHTTAAGRQKPQSTRKSSPNRQTRGRVAPTKTAPVGAKKTQKSKTQKTKP